MELQAQQTPEAGAPPPKRKKSAGERAFDRTVYTGVGFGVNEASSLWITDQFVHGRNLLARVPGLKKIGAWFSEEGFSRASEYIAKVFKLTGKAASDGEPILPRERGGNALLMVTLLSGGTLLILPMKWLENHKIPLVKKANHMIDSLRGNKLSPEGVAARDKEVEQHIACSPRQSWPSMLVGRAVAMCSSVAAGTFLMGPERNQKLMNWSEELLTGSLHSKEHRTAGHRYARLASVETYSCAIASIMLEIMSKLFAKRRPAPHDPEICQDTAAKAAAVLVKNEADDCGCAGNHSAKIQLQKDRAASAPQLMQV